MGKLVCTMNKNTFSASLILKGTSQVKKFGMTVLRHILLKKAAVQKSQKEGGLKVYIFLKLFSRPIQKLMFQAYGCGAT